MSFINGAFFNCGGEGGQAELSDCSSSHHPLLQVFDLHGAYIVLGPGGSMAQDT